MAKTLFSQGENRLNYGDMLLPECGYSLNFAVGLTYSLDLEALLGVPISLGLLDETDDSLIKNPYLLLESIRKSSDKIAIFCNAGSIQMPQHIQSVYALLENSVFEVKLKNGNFHPKLWFVKYSNREGAEYIKLIVLSRNLTFDKSFDYAVSMSGGITKEKYEKNLPLSEMLKFCASNVTGIKKRSILKLAEEIISVKDFNLDERFDDYAFIPFGIGSDTSESILHQKYSDLLVVSPFLSGGIINDLTRCAKNKTLVTRKSSLNSKIMDSFDDVYITKDFVYSCEGKSADSQMPVSNEESITQDIHAKIYFTHGYDGNHLYIGSVNASQNAFHHNVEFLLKLRFSNYMMSYYKIRNDFLPADGFFEKIVALGELPEENEKDKLLDTLFNNVIWAIKKADVAVQGDFYKVAITTTGNKTGKKVQISPLFSPNRFQDFDTQIVFDNIILKDLCEFYVIKIDDKQIVVKIDTFGIPDERDKAIFKSIIGSQAGFLNYVNFLLSDNYSETILEQDEFRKMLEGKQETSFSPVAGLYERMLTCTVNNPYKLLDIDNLLKNIDDELVTDEFKDMYEKFRNIAKRAIKWV